ncbi:hypothetical protein F2Q69_00028262 [Brassica cretica]|uniref:Uncharacterized protein n=1 Tax=Brassica cretica TaxID=69181 RepID=A0A8S9SB55_BRACR|nr:hypothetical protein F2Q69_00028262 [Brassica cretica]
METGTSLSPLAPRCCLSRLRRLLYPGEGDSLSIFLAGSISRHTVLSFDGGSVFGSSGLPEWVSEGFLVVCVVALFLDEFSTSRLTLSGERSKGDEAVC